MVYRSTLSVLMLIFFLIQNRLYRSWVKTEFEQYIAINFKPVLKCISVCGTYTYNFLEVNILLKYVLSYILKFQRISRYKIILFVASFIVE